MWCAQGELFCNNTKPNVSMYKYTTNIYVDIGTIYGRPRKSKTDRNTITKCKLFFPIVSPPLNAGKINRSRYTGTHF